MTNALKVAVLPGDGIGNEVTPAAIAVVERAIAVTGGPGLFTETLTAGAQAYLDTGTALSDEVKRAAEAADAIYLGAMGLPAVRYADGTEITPQIDLRFLFDLYAGVRPTRAIPGVPTPLADPRAADIDFVLVRESTEGLFASLGKGVVENDAVARDFQVITRATTEKVSRFTFDLAARRAAARPGHAAKVTLIDKANVFASFAFMRKVFDEVASTYEGIAAERLYVDASTLTFVGKPWTFDTIVTENMFGDILSDLAAALVGGMGYAPSADIGDAHAVFQPAHGSAPDIMGTGKANPTAAILSGAMMVEWLAERHDIAAYADAARLINRAVDAAFAGGGLLTCELGGSAGMRQVTDAVLAAIDAPATIRAAG
ncbi:isocitrate/isopropylmalate dehydrogenase family protein [Acuticoccus mangrovi]|uniref:Isocitrate/isopropylmalate dehydrogenase family protein n=1 Tax=Acuticoccus mangrovi TaxID=2796142 RepID=A0A934MHE4_9HYPH|nr:isocitrate/isopropylmalate family dehydrogenase [Acuticoccus mangrovi]MBJ3777568.1 isocitrate/isopropylmalate dehydrogenase family protein [Acuticoccus mangrovi]